MNTLCSYLFTLVTAVLLLSAAGCSKETDKCVGVVCQNGGACLDGTCNCPSGFKGSRCEQADVQASFSIENNYCTAPCTTVFKNYSTGGATYLWDFGDGTTSTFKEPSHVYTSGSSSGMGREYQVQLTVTASDGVTKSVTSRTVYIKASTTPLCEQNNTAEVKVTITSSNPYMVNIAGVDVGVVQGNSNRTFTTSATGNKVVKVTQQSGFVFTPTVKTTDINFKPCDVWQWTPVL